MATLYRMAILQPLLNHFPLALFIWCQITRCLWDERNTNLRKNIRISYTLVTFVININSPELSQYIIHSVKNYFDFGARCADMASHHLKSLVIIRGLYRVYHNYGNAVFIKYLNSETQISVFYWWYCSLWANAKSLWGITQYDLHD